jgi:hypothetical protein
MIVTREERLVRYLASSFPRKGERYNNIETAQNQTKIANGRAAERGLQCRAGRAGQASLDLCKPIFFCYSNQQPGTGPRKGAGKRVPAFPEGNDQWKKFGR